MSYQMIRPIIYLSIFLFLPHGNAFAGHQARQLGLKDWLYPSGKKNQITDVPGVKIGHETVSFGKGKLRVGKGPARTGVTVVIPAEGDLWESKVLGGGYVLNGNGEAAGLMWLQESGIIEGPIALTNTVSVSDVHGALTDWTLTRHPEVPSLMPIVLECDDSSLNDQHGRHIKSEQVFRAITNANKDFKEGSVGAGTGMISFDFKSGIGSASRLVEMRLSNGKRGKTYSLGILVNSNIGTGTRQIFRLRGVPIGKEIKDLLPIEKDWHPAGSGSIVVIVATDAPMDSRQLKRLAKRALHGVSRLGGVVYNGSGEIAIAFSTANRIPNTPTELISIQYMPDSAQNEFFEAVVEATEEAVINSLLSAEYIEGRDGNTAHSLPADRLRKILKKYGVVK